MVTRPRQAAARRLAIVALSMIAGTTLARTVEARAERHPLHTTLTELRYDTRERIVRVSVRLFANDLGDALRRRGASGSPDTPAGAAATLAYLSDTFVLASRDGRPFPLRLDGIRRTGDLLWVTMSAASIAGLDGLTLRNALLMEVFADQVNIVQVADGGSTRSLLYTRGAGTKAL